YNILLNLGSEVTFRLQRDGGQSEARMAPRWKPPPGEGEVGIVIGMPQVEIVPVSYPPWEALFLGARQSFDILSLTRNGILSMFARGVQSDAVVGPVGIYQATDRVAQTGTGNLIYLAAFLSMNLGILNILPIPMLDGGRIFFILLELVRRGRRVSPRKESFVHLVGFVLLLALIVVITFNDVLRIVRGENLFQ
ncbi:MAG: site-2 protease family protein, partial [Chloroflexi bacterium]|nr:site-2 protease family protein [Chloroflexota bacterium]